MEPALGFNLWGVYVFVKSFVAIYHVAAEVCQRGPKGLLLLG